MITILARYGINSLTRVSASGHRADRSWWNRGTGGQNSARTCCKCRERARADAQHAARPR